MTESAGTWADQANDLASETDILTIVDDKVNGNKSKPQAEIQYALKWGEQVPVRQLRILHAHLSLYSPLPLQITDELITQICPADLTDVRCDFDYVMPNGCDYNCEMLRLCGVSSTVSPTHLVAELNTL